MKRNLWQINHPYYCNDRNYFCNDSLSEYCNWEDFYGKPKGNGGLEPSTMSEDHDLNLIFRWDWVIIHDDYDEIKHDPNDPKYDDCHHLKLFYMGQRKGIFRCVIIKVRKEDEEKIIEFLKPRWDKMKELWDGIA